jgi:hypothetical protein
VFWAEFIRRGPPERVQNLRFHTHWRWHLDEVYVKIDESEPWSVSRDGGVCRNSPPITVRVHNHFNQERHLIAQDLYYERRLAALAEWRAIMG